MADWSLSLVGSGDDAAAKSAFQSFISSLKAAGQAIGSGAFGTSEQLNELVNVAPGTVSASQVAAP